MLENAGLLPTTLDRQAKLLESLAKIKGQIKCNALSIAIAVLTLIIMFITMLFIRIFVDIYDSAGVPLPDF